MRTRLLNTLIVASLLLSLALYSRQSVVTLGQTSVRPDDTHDWPEWTRFRRQEAKTKPALCQWKGCPLPPTDLHHGIAASWCVKANHPELAYSRGSGQWFLWLCRDHHEFAHNICERCGGNWQKFNPDSAADAKAGKWNSRGRSRWEFQTEREAIMWIRGRVERDD